MAVHVLGSRLRPFFPPPFGEGRWFRARWRSRWAGWAVGGYYASLVLYSSLEGVNEALLPPPRAGVTPTSDSPVSELIRPEGADRVAWALGAAGACVSAPAFEEILYRGFVLPAMSTAGVPLPIALPLQALLFGLHHGSLPALLPLTALGLLWAGLYLASGNLFVPILVHAMWNARVFLDGLLS